MAGRSPGDEIAALTAEIYRRAAAGELDAGAAASLLRSLSMKVRRGSRERRRTDRRTGRDRRRGCAPPGVENRRTGRERRGNADRRATDRRG
jgi:hypothetical protein